MTRKCKPVTLADQIAAREAQLAALRQLAALAGIIAAVVPAGVAFSARELFEYRAVSPALVTACDAAGIRDARQLGKRLRQLCGAGLVRVGDDRHGAIWTVG